MRLLAWWCWRWIIRRRACCRVLRGRWGRCWAGVKGLGLLIGIVSLIRVGVHMLRQQGDGVPDRDDTSDKLVNWAIGVLIISFAVSIFSALGLSVASC